jgi:hypothetical protein
MKRGLLIALFAGGAVFAVALVGHLYFSWRPATLRIAVGPPGSEDVKAIQEVVQAFIRERLIRNRYLLTTLHL